MSRKKTPTQVICREVLQEVIEWKKIASPDENTLKRGIKILLERRLAGVYLVDEGQIFGLIGGVLSMLRAYERKVILQLGMLPAKDALDSITGFMRPAIQPPNVDLAIYDEDAVTAAKIKFQAEAEAPYTEGSNEIDFLSGLSGNESPSGESESEETGSTSPNPQTAGSAA